MNISQAVINVAKFHEDVEFLFLSNDGSECTLQVSKKHPVKLSREDVLKADGKNIKANAADGGGAAEVVKPALAKDLIAQIEVAETVEGVDGIVGADVRATVLAAAEKRKGELKPAE